MRSWSLVRTVVWLQQQQLVSALGLNASAVVSFLRLNVSILAIYLASSSWSLAKVEKFIHFHISAYHLNDLWIDNFVYLLYVHPTVCILWTLYYPPIKYEKTALSYWQDIYILLYTSDRSIITFTKHKVNTRITFIVRHSSCLTSIWLRSYSCWRPPTTTPTVYQT